MTEQSSLRINPHPSNVTVQMTTAPLKAKKRGETEGGKGSRERDSTETQRETARVMINWKVASLNPNTD